MRIHYKDGTRVDIPIETIDSLTFVEETADSTASERAELTGSWLWGSQEQGYYELLTFNEDRTYTGYDNYFTYSFDTWTYGWYAQLGTMLTLQSNGYGYQRRYNWFVIGLSPNALEVMTKMGSFIYYRLQPNTLTLTTGSPLPLPDGDTIVFTDDVIVKSDGTTLLPLNLGTTYILVHHKATDQILAYKVEVSI